MPSTKEPCSNYPQLKAISNEAIQIQPQSLPASQDYEINNDSPTFTENQLSFVQQKMIQSLNQIKMTDEINSRIFFSSINLVF